ncbi:unnamed protein product [Gongylonema pulchrum]|uniref:Uncharacterized protein n=1 Tax=Gongylonema pulchrum TaxID=637853 RepID=A0A183DIB3_9BILA|nr:unnamed protein product [Gongylonema pulchrum]
MCRIRTVPRRRASICIHVVSAIPVSAYRVFISDLNSHLISVTVRHCHERWLC